jgi:small-conductance mechanosensitive channel
VLIATNDDRRQLVRVTNEYRDLIDRRIFWVRSAPPLGLDDLSHARAAVAWLTDPRTWREAGNMFVSRLWSHPIQSLLGAVVLSLLFGRRRRIKTKLEDLGREASDISCRAIQPTMQALLLVVQVGIAYGSDTNHARDLILRVAKDNSNVMEDPPPSVIFEQFGDSTLNFGLRAFLANMDDRMETIHQLHTDINRRFGEEGIEIAVPQRDLHLRSLDPSVRLGESARIINRDEKSEDSRH